MRGSYAWRYIHNVFAQTNKLFNKNNKIWLQLYNCTYVFRKWTETLKGVWFEGMQFHLYICWRSNLAMYKFECAYTCSCLCERCVHAVQSFVYCQYLHILRCIRFVVVYLYLRFSHNNRISMSNFVLKCFELLLILVEIFWGECMHACVRAYMRFYRFYMSNLYFDGVQHILIPKTDRHVCRE